MESLVSIRHSIDTRDEFYDDEMKFWNTSGPVLEEYRQEWNKAMLESPFRPQFEEEYGNVMFIKAEMAKKTFAPEIIPDLQKENELAREREEDALARHADALEKGGGNDLHANDWEEHHQDAQAVRRAGN